MNRFVLDTNVIISAVLMAPSVPGQAFVRCLAEGIVLVSNDLILELSEVLGREKFNRYITKREREKFLEALIREAELVEIAETIDACRDPKDNKLLELAVSGHASCIITGDQDLLTLHPFREIPILNPAAFMQSFGQP